MRLFACLLTFIISSFLAFHLSFVFINYKFINLNFKIIYLEKFQFIRQVTNALFPKKAYHSAGCDLFSVKDGQISSGSISQIETGIQVVIPQGHVGIIKSRSGLASQKGIYVLGILLNNFILFKKSTFF
jgi:hypothetical protein